MVFLLGRFTGDLSIMASHIHFFHSFATQSDDSRCSLETKADTLMDSI